MKKAKKRYLKALGEFCFTAQGPEVASVWASASAGVSMSTAPTSGSVTYSSTQRREAMGK